MSESVLLKKSPGMLKFAAVIAALAFLSYVNNLGHDWAYDDHKYITENEFVRNPVQIGDIFSTTYLYGVNGLQTGIYRPVTILSYSLNSAVTGLSPSFFHLVNNLIHTANSVLVLLVLTAFTGVSSIAFVAALLFAAHPVHTEAVNNVVGRAELLSFLFMMFSLLMYSMREGNRKIYYSLSLLFFMAALMSKEIPSVLPLIILLYVFGCRTRGECRYVKRDVFEAMGYFIILVMYMVIRYAVVRRCGPVPEPMFADNPLVVMSFMERLPTALSVLVRYAVLLVFPLRLSADYSYNQIPLVDSLGNVMPIAGLALIVLFVIAGIRTAGRSHMLYLGILLVGLPCMVISNIFFTTGTIMGERLMYIPSLGFTILFALGIIGFFRGVVKRPQLALWAVFLITTIYAGRTLARNPDWKDNETIFTRTAQTSPNSVKTSYNYALVLRSEGRLEEAITEYRHAVSIWPGHQRAWYNLGNALSENRQYREAVDAYKRSLEIFPDDSAALHNLALTYKNLNEPEKAVETFRKILEFRPDDLSARLNIGNMWVQMEDYDRAMEAFKDNVRVNSRDVLSLANIGNIYLIRGDTLEAETYYKLSIDIEPANSSSQNALLAIFIAQNRLDEAEKKIREMQTNKIPIRKTIMEKFIRNMKK